VNGNHKNGADSKILVSEEEKNKIIYNPVEKNLYVGCFGVDKLKSTDEAFLLNFEKKVIDLSGANLVELIKHSDKTGISIVSLLSESGLGCDSGLHTSPDYDFLSIMLRTCGNKTHPFMTVKYILNELDPVIADIKYFKKGIDLKISDSNFPKSIFSLLSKYKDQIDESKYTTYPQQLKVEDYDILCIDKKRIDDSLIKYIKKEHDLDVGVKPNANGKDYLLTLEICMKECKGDIDYESLEKIINSYSKIKSSDTKEKGRAWITEDGSGHIYFLNNTTFKIESLKGNPIKLLHPIVDLCAPERADISFKCNEQKGLIFPMEAVVEDDNYHYRGVSYASQDTIEFKCYRKTEKEKISK